MLSEHTSRCLGVWSPEQFGVTVPCAKRESCARYVQRETGKYVAPWLCPTPEDWYGAFLPEKPKEAA